MVNNYSTLIQKLVSDASLKLVECCGYYDVEMTCQYLALYQVRYSVSMYIRYNKSSQYFVHRAVWLVGSCINYCYKLKLMPAHHN